MKNLPRLSLKNIMGVTLLEIMLVLAVAAMVIVMSIRYYQTANTSQQSNATLSQIQSIVATADNLSQASGSYLSVTTVALAGILPAGGLTTAWGTAITVVGTATALVITFTGAFPTPVCTLLTAKLAADTHYTVATACATVTYSTA